jgi:hypothetical protein
MLQIGMKIKGWSDDQNFWDELDELGYNYQGISTERYLELGSQQNIINFKEDDEEVRTSTSVEIRKETEKAIEIVVEFTTYEIFDGEIENEQSGKYSYWLPKSQVKMEEEKIIIPDWLAKEKGITRYGNKVSIITELK